MDPLLYSPEDAAAKLAVSRSRLYELLADGSLRSIRIGRSRRVPSTALAEFVEGLLERDSPTGPDAA